MKTVILRTLLGVALFDVVIGLVLAIYAIFGEGTPHIWRGAFALLGAGTMSAWFFYPALKRSRSEVRI